jgi:Tol biopolymer transport system component
VAVFRSIKIQRDFRTKRFAFVAYTALSVFLALGMRNEALAQLTEMVSISSSGTQGNDISGRFSGPAISADGLVVAFDSQATNLVPSDTNLKVDVFVHDRTTNITDRVSVTSAGVQGNGTSTRPGIDGTGNLIVFDSSSTDLVPGDTNSLLDVFLHNRTTHTTERISVSSDEVQGNSGSNTPSITPDGRYVCFISLASNLVPGDTNGCEDVFVRDLLLGTTTRVSLGDQGQQGNSSTTYGAISANGRWVAFSSFANNFIPGDTNDAFDTFVRDLQTGTTQRVSVDSNEQQANAPSVGPSVSDDGVVVFYSDATNLVPGDTNDWSDIFARDVAAGTTERISVSSNEEQSNGSSPEPGVRGFIASVPQISPDGRYVAFFSAAANLVPDDTNTCTGFVSPGRCPDVFVRDRVAGTTVRVSVASDGTQANDRCSDPSMTPDGQGFAFFSAAGNLVVGDANACQPIFPISCPDIFVHQTRGETGVASDALASTALSLIAKPNPSRGAIQFALAGANPHEAWLVVYDVAGRRVRTLAKGILLRDSVTWDGRDELGMAVKPGTYFVRFTSGDRGVTEKITLLQR